jgi:hypothetical protein
MDSQTGFDDDEDFFGSYDAEQGGVSLAPLGFDDAEAQPPTPERLAHLTRFRRPVAAVVASMALLSIVALGIHGSRQHGAQRGLVAHYGASVAAPTLATTATVKYTAPAPEASTALVPEAWSALIAEAWSALVPAASAAANAAAPALGVDASAPALGVDASAPALGVDASALGSAPPNATVSEASSQLDASPASAFSSPPAPICLLPEANRRALGRRGNAAGARPLLTTNPRFFVPAKSAATKSAPIAAPPPATTFNSVARFPNVQ